LETFSPANLLAQYHKELNLTQQKQTTETKRQNTQKANLNLIKLKPKRTVNFNNCSHVCAYHCAQLSYTIQHRTVLIIFPLIEWTTINAQML